ncbi:MAG: hypothetical protein IJO36_04795 [Clostridia bacterium]|nr:hypothetical protein [Clostridia bacterium]
MDKIRTALISLKNVTPASWIRLIMLIVSLVGVGFRLFGADYSAESEEFAKDAAAVIVLIISSVSAYWKNNSFTEAAQAADAILSALKKSR